MKLASETLNKCCCVKIKKKTIKNRPVMEQIESLRLKNYKRKEITRTDMRKKLKEKKTVNKKNLLSGSEHTEIVICCITLVLLGQFSVWQL